MLLTIASIATTLFTVLLGLGMEFLGLLVFFNVLDIHRDSWDTTLHWNGLIFAAYGILICMPPRRVATQPWLRRCYYLIWALPFLHFLYLSITQLQLDSILKYPLFGLIVYGVFVGPPFSLYLYRRRQNRLLKAGEEAHAQ